MHVSIQLKRMEVNDWRICVSVCLCFAFKPKMRLHFTEKEGNVTCDPLHNSQGQLGGNLCKKVIMEPFTSFSSIAMRYQVCHNLTDTLWKTKIMFFTSISLDVGCKYNIHKAVFIFFSGTRF